MRQATLILIEVPPDLWKSWPVDRPFEQLAGDATSSERRINKGVATGRERARYTQLCDWIELSALRLLREGRIKHSLKWSDAEGEASVGKYLRLIELLQTHPALRANLRVPLTLWDRIVAFFIRRPVDGEGKSTRDNPVGKSFYPPGMPVSEQQGVYSLINPKRLKAIAPQIAEEERLPYVTLAREKANFCRAASRRGSAVVEVLATQPG